MTKHFSARARLQSMRFALNGLGILWREQHNSRVHLFATIIVVSLALFLRMPPTQWVMLLLLIALVWVTEALNTAVEYLSDRVTKDQDMLIGKAKDVAAAAVLVASIVAVLGGLLLFIPLLID